MTTKLFFLQKSFDSPTELQQQDIKIHLLEGNIQYKYRYGTVIKLTLGVSTVSCLVAAAPVCLRVQSPSLPA